MRLRAIITGAVALALAAGPLPASAVPYIRDNARAKAAAETDAALQGALALKVYDDQLARLKAFAGREDQAEAALGVAQRDAVVAEILSAPLVKPKGKGGDKTRAEKLHEEACLRLSHLTGQSICDKPADLDRLAAFEPDYASGRRIERQFAGLVVSARRTYERHVEKTDRLPKYDCKGLASAPITGPEHDALTTLRSHCRRHTDQTRYLEELIQTSRWGGLLDGASSALALYDKEASTLAPPAGLEAEIHAAVDAAKATRAAELVTHAKAIEKLLDGASTAARVAGWQAAEDQFNDALRFIVCGRGAKADSCAETDSSDDRSRAIATWEVLQALATLDDARNPKVRSARWLAAARAIAGAQKRDAQLQLAAVKARGALAQARHFMLLREASLLAQAVQHLEPGKGEERKPCPREASSCALPLYVASWNLGHIQAEVLAAREIQIFRETTVRRQKAAAEAQRELILSASASLKAAAEAGLEPSLIAQSLYGVSSLIVAGAR